MNATNYTTSFTVDNTPEEVFAGINNVRGWWSRAIEGSTDKLGAEFNYHYQDVHRSTFKITEMVPGKRVVWHVLDNAFNFIKDQSEWVGTDIVFDITKNGEQTEVRFTHVGLVLAYECFEVCRDAWGVYINGSLRDLITSGKGNPNPIEEVVEKARQMSDTSYTTTSTFDKSPEEVFAAVNNVRGWWSQAIEGSTDKLGAEFTFHYQDLHRSTQRITEMIPGKRVVWRVIDSRLNFLKDKSEWNGTDIVFDIVGEGEKTELRFTHRGLTPAIECYNECSEAWSHYLKDSLRDLIDTGQGRPEPKETENAAVAA